MKHPTALRKALSSSLASSTWSPLLHYYDYSVMSVSISAHNFVKNDMLLFFCKCLVDLHYFLKSKATASYFVCITASVLLTSGAASR